MPKWLKRLVQAEAQVQAFSPVKLERQALWAYEAALQVLGPERTAQLPPQYWASAYWGLSALQDGAPLPVVAKELHPQAPWLAPEPQCLRIIEEWLASPDGEQRF